MMYIKTLPTQEYLKSIFTLNEETGWLIWLHDPSKPNNWNGRCAGTAAGSIKKEHIHVSVNGSRYLAHRLIWMYLYGYDPIDIDHKDGNGFNNCPENLREATRSQNLANANFGNCRGVERHGKKFRVRIFVDNVRINLGSFDTLEEAKEASVIGHSRYFGEFAFCNREAN